MKLVSLKLTDFGNHKHTEIEFGPTSVFMGEHGHGKSTILDGIEYAITGMCRAMTQRNQDKEMIREGAVKAMISLVFLSDNFDGKIMIERKINKSTSVLKVGLTAGENLAWFEGTEAQNKIYEMLGFGYNLAKVLFSASKALDMKAQDLKKLLQELFTADESKIISYLEGKGVKNLPDDVKAEMTAAFVAEGLGEVKSNDKYTGVYGYCVNKRIGYKRQIDNLAELTAPDVDPEAKNQDPAKIVAKIDELNEQRDTLLASVNVDAGKSEQIQATIDRLNTEISELSNGLTDGNALKLAAGNATTAENDALTILGRAKTKADITSEVAKVNNTLDNMAVVNLEPLQKTADAAGEELRKAKDELLQVENIAAPITSDDRLNTAAEVLVEMGAAASDETVKALGAMIAERPEFDHDKHQRDIQSAKDWVESYENEVIKSQQAITDARQVNQKRDLQVERLDTLKQQLTGYGDDLSVESAQIKLDECVAIKDTAKQALDDYNTAVNNIEGKKRDLRQAETELGELPVAADKTETESTIKILDGRITAALLMQTEVAAWKQYESSNAESVKTLELLQAKYDNWDNIAKLLNPKTCDTSFLLGDSFGSFTKNFSSIAKSLGMPSSISPDFNITSSVKRDDDMMASKGVEWLNRAHQGLVGIALQLAICNLVGFKSLIVDDGDTYLGELRTALSCLLLMVRVDKKLVPVELKGIDSVVLLSAGKAPESPPQVKGLKFYDVVDGAITGSVPF